MPPGRGTVAVGLKRSGPITRLIGATCAGSCSKTRASTSFSPSSKPSRRACSVVRQILDCFRAEQSKPWRIVWLPRAPSPSPHTMGGPCDEPGPTMPGPCLFALGVEPRIVGEGRAIGHA